MTQDYSNEKITNNELLIKLDNLTSIVNIGFSGMERRQNLTNGNVIKNTEFRIGATATFVTLKWLIGLIGLGTLVNVISNFTNLLK